MQLARVLPLSIVVAIVTGQALASAGSPTAIVEDVQARTSTLLVMDYLFAGDQVTLGAGETLTISYFASCAIEEITGGVITIGTVRSMVRGVGKVTRTFVQCGGTNVVLTGRQASQAAGVVVRGDDSDPAASGPPLMVYSQVPVFVFSQPTKRVTIERIDGGEGAPFSLSVHGRYSDMASYGVTLQPGATYRARADEQSVLFTIAVTAPQSTRNIISRLIGL